MPDQHIDISQTIVELDFMQAGGSDSFVDGHVHEKRAPCLIIAQPIRGQYEVRCRRRHGIANPGEVFLAATDDPLRITHHADDQRGGSMSARWVHARFLLQGTIDITALLDMPLILGGSWGLRLGEIVAELRQGATPGGELLWLARRRELAFQLLRILCVVSTRRASSESLLHMAERLQPVLAYMKQNLCRPFTVQDLAQVAHMSVSRFHAVFRRQARASPMAYAKRLRVREAQRLLLTSDVPLYQVAAATGFSNAFHFSREFKILVGMPPSQYRREHTDLLV